MKSGTFASIALAVLVSFAVSAGAQGTKDSAKASSGKPATSTAKPAASNSKPVANIAKPAVSSAKPATNSPAGIQGSGTDNAFANCQTQARRPDGSSDQMALQACLQKARLAQEQNKSISGSMNKQAQEAFGRHPR